MPDYNLDKKAPEKEPVINKPLQQVLTSGGKMHGKEEITFALSELIDYVESIYSKSCGESNASGENELRSIRIDLRGKTAGEDGRYNS